MENFEISMQQTVEFIEDRLTDVAYFKNINTEGFWKAVSNGKTSGFYFSDEVEYQFNFKSLYSLFSKLLKQKITYVQLKFVLEVISLLEDDWDFEDGVFDEVIFLSQKDFHKHFVQKIK